MARIRNKMARISDLSEELLVKILSFLPTTKDAVSTSILSKQWEFLWMWLPNLKFDYIDGSMRDFINKNLPLHRAPIIKSLDLSFVQGCFRAETFKSWVEIAVSRGIRNLTICGVQFIPKSLYTCNTLVTLELKGAKIIVDVPRTVCLNSLKKLHLEYVTYSNGDSLPLLLSCCPVLEDLLICRKYYDNMGGAMVIILPSLLRLYLDIHPGCSNGWCKIITPSLKYFRIWDGRRDCSYLIEHMPKLEEADIRVDNSSSICLGNLLRSVSGVKSLSLGVFVKTGNETKNVDGNVFSKLENLKLTASVCGRNWSKVTYQLLKDSPKLQVLDLVLQFVDEPLELGEDDELVGWIRNQRSLIQVVGWTISNQSLVPECLLSSLKTFKFRGCTEEVEARDILCFINKHACCLESPPILCLRNGNLQK